MENSMEQSIRNFTHGKASNQISNSAALAVYNFLKFFQILNTELEHSKNKPLIPFNSFFQCLIRESKNPSDRSFLGILDFFSQLTKSISNFGNAQKLVVHDITSKIIKESFNLESYSKENIKASKMIIFENCTRPNDLDYSEFFIFFDKDFKLALNHYILYAVVFKKNRYFKIAIQDHPFIKLRGPNRKKSFGDWGSLFFSALEADFWPQYFIYGQKSIKPSLVCSNWVNDLQINSMISYATTQKHKFYSNCSDFIQNIIENAIINEIPYSNTPEDPSEDEYERILQSYIELCETKIKIRWLTESLTPRTGIDQMQSVSLDNSTEGNVTSYNCNDTITDRSLEDSSSEADKKRDHEEYISNSYLDSESSDQISRHNTSIN